MRLIEDPLTDLNDKGKCLLDQDQGQDKDIVESSLLIRYHSRSTTLAFVLVLLRFRDYHQYQYLSHLSTSFCLVLILVLLMSLGDGDGDSDGLIHGHRGSCCLVGYSDVAFYGFGDGGGQGSELKRECQKMMTCFVV